MRFQVQRKFLPCVAHGILFVSVGTFQLNTVTLSYSTCNHTFVQDVFIHSHAGRIPGTGSSWPPRIESIVLKKGTVPKPQCSRYYCWSIASASHWHSAVAQLQHTGFLACHWKVRAIVTFTEVVVYSKWLCGGFTTAMVIYTVGSSSCTVHPSHSALWTGAEWCNPSYCWMTVLYCI